jgi:hypothetical protein
VKQARVPELVRYDTRIEKRIDKHGMKKGKAANDDGGFVR